MNTDRSIKDELKSGIKLPKEEQIILQQQLIKFSERVGRSIALNGMSAFAQQLVSNLLQSTVRHGRCVGGGIARRR
jgi:hypothetical protein